ncbi:MAG: pilus assembly protein PilM [Proteobacteria bacterium]|nr:pilus assembly protein PilM [Pseudomonadota bacterium]
MIEGLFKSKKDLFGIDIGSQCIKLVELKKTRKDYKVRKLGIKQIPKDIIIDGAIMDSVALTDAVRDIVQTVKPTVKNVALSVSGQGVIVKKISVPIVTEEEFANSIQWESEQYLPFSIQDVYLDFKILGATENIQGQMDVLLAAAKKELIDDYLLIIRDLGFEPMVVDIDVFAIQNMFEVNYPSFTNKTNLICNIGASFTNINIVKGGDSLFTRTINVAGNKVTEALQKNLGITFEEAEEVKVGVKKDVDMNSVNEILDEEINVLTGEIQRTIDFFYNSNPNDIIENVFLFGGSSKLKGLPEKIKDKSGINAIIGNPFTNIPIDKSQQDISYHHFGVAVGLGMRRLGDK